ncbi:hypothetical protein [Mesorhizobium sp. CN2-181]|uniref:hypothetical protein n=1 Tax=Mesorhizobium yinganensis TaxID=3157707 RepID=UPI0032B8638B
MAVEITIDRAADNPGVYLVAVAHDISATFIPKHRDYWSALSEGLRLQREFRPAILHDRVVQGGAHHASP